MVMVVQMKSGMLISLISALLIVTNQQTYARLIFPSPFPDWAAGVGPALATTAVANFTTAAPAAFTLASAFPLNGTTLAG